MYEGKHTEVIDMHSPHKYLASVTDLWSRDASKVTKVTVEIKRNLHESISNFLLKSKQTSGLTTRCSCVLLLHFYLTITNKK